MFRLIVVCWRKWEVRRLVDNRTRKRNQNCDRRRELYSSGTDHLSSSRECETCEALWSLNRVTAREGETNRRKNSEHFCSFFFSFLFPLLPAVTSFSTAPENEKLEKKKMVRGKHFYYIFFSTFRSCSFTSNSFFAFPFCHYMNIY